MHHLGIDSMKNPGTLSWIFKKINLKVRLNFSNQIN